MITENRNKEKPFPFLPPYASIICNNYSVNTGSVTGACPIRVIV